MPLHGGFGRDRRVGELRGERPVFIPPRPRPRRPGTRLRGLSNHRGSERVGFSGKGRADTAPRPLRAYGTITALAAWRPGGHLPSRTAR
ncbi:hypothetical protein [Streptomyces silvisoli]|uniref:Uncharacterized protein n=1 Tax=Streptomyces silvisoli TaxID=3034235 RepID=A0ABT5ZDW5_9ACTN|nr:hypothetical protein [Streptomyces silvisoli]MDF3288022.1 hypothetical protein [Streptomyces silvisoli]